VHAWRQGCWGWRRRNLKPDKALDLCRQLHDDPDTGIARTQLHLVIVSHIEYNDPELGWQTTATFEDGHDTVCVMQGTQVEVRAVHNQLPGITDWPDGKPTWTVNGNGAGSGVSKLLTLTDTGNTLVVASCGNSLVAHFEVIRLAALQYEDPDLGWVTLSDADTEGTLHVVSDTLVRFRALRDPPGDLWPAGFPAWEWTGGEPIEETATVEIRFDGGATRTVSVSSGTTTRPATVKDGELQPSITPGEDFQFEGRSHTRFGVGEIADLDVHLPPSFSPERLGRLRWQQTQGWGQVENDSTFSGKGTFEAFYDTPPGGLDHVVLRLTVESGPSKSLHRDVELDVVQPSLARYIWWAKTGIKHVLNMDYCTFKCAIFLEPKDVSFVRCYFSEGSCDLELHGWFAAIWPQNQRIHEEGPALPLLEGNIQLGSAVNAEDESGLWFAGWGEPDEGWVINPIPVRYRVGEAGTWVPFGTVRFRCDIARQDIDPNKRLLIVQKQDVGPFARNFVEPTHGYEWP
jgi:hypothetical protein